MDRLLDLQEIDTAAGRLEARRAALEEGEEMRALRNGAEKAEILVGELRLAIDAEGKEQRRLEHDIETLELKTADEEKRMYDGSIVNEKELSAVQHEIANLKTRRSAFEDDLLDHMERLEGLQKDLSDASLSSEETRARVEEAGGEAGEELARVQRELSERRAAREALLPEFDSELLELYEELLVSKKGIAAAPLVDGTCQGCHQKLSAVVLDKLKHTDGVKRCEHCRRILITR
jgi:predicted  nucleic acid-binding Zn-ribbon protein